MFLKNCFFFSWISEYNPDRSCSNSFLTGPSTSKFDQNNTQKPEKLVFLLEKTICSRYLGPTHVDLAFEICRPQFSRLILIFHRKSIIFTIFDGYLVDCQIWQVFKNFPPVTSLPLTPPGGQTARVKNLKKTPG